MSWGRQVEEVGSGELCWLWLGSCNGVGLASAPAPHPQQLLLHHLLQKKRKSKMGCSYLDALKALSLA